MTAICRPYSLSTNCLPYKIDVGSISSNFKVYIMNVYDVPDDNMTL